MASKKIGFQKLKDLLNSSKQKKVSKIYYPEAADRKCSLKQVFLKISQCSQKTPVLDSLFIFYRTPLVVAPDYRTNIRSSKKSKNVVLEEYREKRFSSSCIFICRSRRTISKTLLKTYSPNIINQLKSLIAQGVWVIRQPAPGPHIRSSARGPYKILNQLNLLLFRVQSL